MKFKFKNIVWGISQKADGQMRFGDDEKNACTRKNRIKFFNKIGIDGNSVVSAGLVHQKKIAVVDQSRRGLIIPDTDGLVTNQKNLFLTITVADCMPIYFFDFKNKVIAIVHAGWKGALFNICAIAVNKMSECYRTNPREVVVFVGPHIQKCHFEVQEDVAGRFVGKYREFIINEKNRIKVDLSGIIRQQLLERGLLPQNISISPDCIFSLKNKYFSNRRDKPVEVQAMIAYIGICPGTL